MANEIEVNMPSASDAGSANYTASITGWVTEAIKEGEQFLKEEWGFREIDKYLAYMMEGSDATSPIKPSHLANFPINRAFKSVNDIISTLSDIKPVFNYVSTNPLYQHQAILMNRLIKNWWINEDIDVRLGEIVSWSLVAGTGYGWFDWDKKRNNMGLSAVDPRDIIPIRPSSRGDLNDCLGIVRRIPVTVNEIKAAYPDKAILIKPDYEGSFLRQRIRRITQAITSPLDRLTGKNSTADMNIPMCNLYIVQLRDDRRNNSSSEVQVGDPETNWGYKVPPGGLLYPRGRWIICTSSVVLEDIPNPHWHGRFTTIKLNLDPFPWSWFGKSVLADLIPINDLLNELVSKVVQAARKTLNPGLIYDKNVIGDAIAKNIDTSRPGMKLRVNPNLGGEGFKFTDPVEVPQYVLELIRMAVEQIDDIAGTRGLAELLNLQQMPGADTIEKLQAAMSPAIKRRGRHLEAALRELAELAKFDMMQFYTIPRRLQILGPEGQTFEDFDYEPGTLVPKTDPNDPRSSWERAAEHARSFPFYTEPGSLLQITQEQEKMLYMQLRRQGDMDHRTLLEKCNIHNIDQIDSRLNSELDQKIGMVTGAQPQVGRPPTAQSMPDLQQKGDGRIVMSESS